MFARVPDRTEMRVVGGNPISQLMHAVLAHQHRAGFRELFINRRIMLGNMLGENLRSAGSTNALRRKDILQRIRNAMQRTAINPASQFIIGTPRLV